MQSAMNGKLTLIKSTLVSFPIYHLLLFSIPRSVDERLNKLVREFLWNDKNELRKLHLVKWKTVYETLKKGA